MYNILWRYNSTKKCGKKIHKVEPSEISCNTVLKHVRKRSFYLFKACGLKL